MITFVWVFFGERMVDRAAACDVNFLCLMTQPQIQEFCDNGNKSLEEIFHHLNKKSL